ncbi:HDOD domain-containing protein [bacterium]|nr:HDOD domain-containing protein [bacterium]
MFPVDKIISQIDKLPSLPTSVGKVIEVANNPKASPVELSNVIKIDPVLTAKVLKLVNSAYFSLPDQITNLNRAIILLGINTIKNLAISTAVVGQFSKTKHKRFDIDKYWKHCMAVAVLSKKFAQQLKVDKRFLEEYFIAGLLHDIGEVVIIELFPDKLDQMMNKVDAGAGLEEVEREFLGSTHSEIGAALGRHWKISENLIAVIEEHHDPNIAGDFAQMVLTVHMANIYCNQNNLGMPGCHTAAAAPEIIAKLGLDPGMIAEATSNLDEELNKATSFLKTAGAA